MPVYPEKIPAVTHVDETCRIQTVSSEVNPRYHRLIEEFEKVTGIPVLLNTSFNIQEPIVCTPTDALRTFKRSKIDYLAIGNFIVKSTKAQ
jgi:carbamoyltransferase